MTSPKLNTEVMFHNILSGMLLSGLIMKEWSKKRILDIHYTSMDDTKCIINSSSSTDFQISSDLIYET
jgi:hypothetical protein